MAIAFLKNENTVWKILSMIDYQMDRFKSCLILFFDMGLVECDRLRFFKQLEKRSPYTKTKLFTSHTHESDRRLFQQIPSP